MNLLNITETAAFLSGCGSCLVYTHATPDGDTVGSGTALVLALRAAGINAFAVNADGIPAKLDFLLHERPKNSPDIFDGNMLSRDDIYNALVRENLCKMLENPSGLSAKELLGYVHLEKFPVEPFGFEEKPAVVLFDYRHRDMRGNSEYILIGDR